MAWPLLGHFDPEFLTLMDEIQELLRYVVPAANRMTKAISETGMAGMETICRKPPWLAAGSNRST
jgi:alanine-glyoxylate transaminase/serine-glyoxylate transaminase/serine-pyruvate transaminase